MDVEVKNLPWVEVAVIVASLAGTMLVGLHFSRSGYKSLNDYIFGGRKMTMLPITLSVTATLVSGSSFISTGQEHYLYGSQFFVTTLWILPVCFLAAYFYLPVFYTLRSVSLYEYFDRRFSCAKVRTLVSMVSVLDTILVVILSLYIPSLTLSHASGIPMFPLACALSILSFVYTITGGLKAVAWADSFQMIIIIIVSVVFFVVGIDKAGGWSEVIRKNNEGFRLEFSNFNPTPFQRASVITSLGGTINWMLYYLSPSTHQKFNSLPKLEMARKAMIWSSVLMVVVLFLHSMLGFPLYAYYAGCDPVLAKKGITSYSNIVPHFIEDISEGLPGLTGLFYAGLIAAGLSTVTSYWNTAGCTIFEDLVKPRLKEEHRDEKTSFYIIMVIVSTLAVISTCSVYFVGNMGTIMETVVTLRCVNYSASALLFNAGLFLPWVSSKGLIAGAITTAVVQLITTIGSVSVRNAGHVRDIHRVLTTANCATNSTLSFSNATVEVITEGWSSYGSVTEVDDGVFWLFKLSMFLMALPSLITGILVALAYSFLTGTQDLKTLDPTMIVPQLRWLLPTPSNFSPIDLNQTSLDRELEEMNTDVIRTNKLQNIVLESEKLITTQTQAG